jgi:hypothetical protein
VEKTYLTESDPFVRRWLETGLEILATSDRCKSGEFRAKWA